MSGFKYPRGSEWRKWDLHVHTKIVQNYVFSSENSISRREQNNEEYPRVFIEHIYSIESLGAVALTDHNSAEWIDKIIKDNEKFVSQNNIETEKMITIFPGVEVESSDGIHLLVIFNPESATSEYRKSTWKGTVEHFLTSINSSGKNNSPKTTEEIMDTAEQWDAICIFAHVTSDKGFFRISSGSSKIRIYKHRLTQIFQRFFNASFNEGQENIIEGHDPQYCDERGNSKSVCCITASDAKKLLDIAANNCWIKSDPTYEGLKQIIYEPEERVYMGEEPPRKLNRGKIIKSLTVSNSNTWFADNKPLLLNEGLISVIGGKGTGKTAVLDLIAYATKSYRIFKEGEKSFLKKAFKELIDAKITVEWVEGVPDEREIGHKLEESPKDGKLRYIPQDFVDQLCSEIGKRELEEQIENVIFQKIPREDKATYVNFLSYKNDQVKVINDKKQRKAKQIEEINSKIYWLKNSISTKNKKIEEIKKTKDEISKLNNEMKKISESLEDAKNQQEILNEINALNMEKSNLEKEISELNAKLLKIEEVKNRLSMYKEDAEVFVEEIKVDLELIQISQELIEQTKIVFYPENIEEILGTRKSEVEKKRSAKKEKLSKVSDKSRNLNKNLKLEKSKQDSIQKINVILSKETKKLDSLNAEFREIEQAEKNIPDLLSQRDILFIDFFELLFEEKEKLESIYSPLESILKKSAEENERLFDFTVQFDFDIKSMAEKADGFIDHTKEGRFWHKTKAAIYAELERLKFMPNLKNGKISDADKDTARRFLKDVKGLFMKDEKGKELTVVSQLREGYTEKNFDDWLHSTSYYSITYSIKFNDIELDNLSPGLKGVALLILYLELDKEDTRPILIDQPEENLDNRSVYKTLMRYFREAKKRRQIIIVTHNPNLVVNTDSEQIIVANFDKGLEKQCARINYVSGSLENTFKLSKNDYPEEDWNKIPDLQKEGIREHVCEILEGGREAFEKREKKYGFKTS